MIKVSEIQNLSKEELIEKEGQLKKQLMQLRFDAKLGKLEKHSTIKDARRDIARVLTVLNQQKAAGANSQTVAKTSAKAPSASGVAEKKSQQNKAETKSQGKTAGGAKAQNKSTTSRSAS